MLESRPEDALVLLVKLVKSTVITVETDETVETVETVLLLRLLRLLSLLRLLRLLRLLNLLRLLRLWRLKKLYWLKIWKKSNHLLTYLLTDRLKARDASASKKIFLFIFFKQISPLTSQISQQFNGSDNLRTWDHGRHIDRVCMQFSQNYN